MIINYLNINQSLNIPAGKFAGEDTAAKKRRELRDLLRNGESVKVATTGNAMNQNGEATISVKNSEGISIDKFSNLVSINVEDNLIVPTVDFLPEESNTETIWYLNNINAQFIESARRNRLDKIPFIYKGSIIHVQNSINSTSVFEYYFKQVMQCWRVIKEFQNLASALHYPVDHHIDPNLFLQSFRNSAGVNIKGNLSKSIIRGTGLKTSFDQEFYVNVDDLRFPYCELEVLIVYTLKNLGLTFLNLSKAYKDYRFIYCREMLEDVIKTSDYVSKIYSDFSGNESISPIDYMPYGLYCYKNKIDNSIHILHYIWDNDGFKINSRGYYMREITVRSKFKFCDEVSYSDLEFEKNDTLITKFIINN